MRKFLRCILCDDVVLALIGQDVMLDAFYLRSEPLDREALNAGACGLVHLACLIHSPWGSFWANRITESMRDALGLPVIFESDDLILLRNESLEETIAIRRDGWFAYLRERALARQRPIEGGALVPVRHELNFDLSEYPEARREVNGSFRGGQAYPLTDLVDRLGLRSHLFSALALEGGRLERLPSSGSDLQSNPAFVSSIVLYSKFVPEDVIREVL